MPCLMHYPIQLPPGRLFPAQREWTNADGLRSEKREAARDHGRYPCRCGLDARLAALGRKGQAVDCGGEKVKEGFSGRFAPLAGA